MAAVSTPHHHHSPLGASYKECGCGRLYSRATWQELPHVGCMIVRGKAIELRTCACASTIAVLLSVT